MGFFLLGSLPGSSTRIELPIVDVLELKVDGSGAGGVNVSLVKSFDVISRLVTHMEFLDNAIDFTGFGSGAALANGIRLIINFSNTETSFLNGDTIQSNNQLGHVGFDIIRLADDRNPKGQVILSRLSFDKFSPVGIDNRTGLLSEFFIQVQDDLTDANTTHLEVSVEGYQILRTNYFDSIDDYFYPNQVFIIVFEDLKIDASYSLLLNTSIQDPSWYNFTAKNTNHRLELFYQPDTRQVVNLYLYEEGSFVQQESRFIQDNNLTGYTPLIINIVFALALILVLYMIFSFFTKSRRR